MAARYVYRSGAYGQVEANRLTGITFGDMESQAPAYIRPTLNADEELEPIQELENGQFLCVVPDLHGVSPMGRIAVLPGNAPAGATPFLVFSERKIYDERHMSCDFVDRAADKVDGLLYPRLVGITPDTDIYTTNTIDVALTDERGHSLEVGDVLYIQDNGYLGATAGINRTYQFVVVKVYTMPDGQPGVKLMSQAYAPTT